MRLYAVLTTVLAFAVVRFHAEVEVVTLALVIALALALHRAGPQRA